MTLTVAGRCVHCRQRVAARHVPVDFDPNLDLYAVDVEHEGGRVDCDLPTPPGRSPYTATPETRP